MDCHGVHTLKSISIDIRMGRRADYEELAAASGSPEECLYSLYTVYFRGT